MKAVLTFVACIIMVESFSLSDIDKCDQHWSFPSKTACAEGERDDGTSCWLDSYGRGAGRLPDKAPCPDGLRDDGTSCWSDAHIYGKGCCCTLWGCCHNCPSGYTDDGCTCRKNDVGIKLTLFDRQSCRDDEDMYGGLCYPKCREGYHAVECCICEPDGGPRITTTLFERNYCTIGALLLDSLCVVTDNCTFDEVKEFLKDAVEWTSENLQKLQFFMDQNV